MSLAAGGDVGGRPRPALSYASARRQRRTRHEGVVWFHVRPSEPCPPTGVPLVVGIDDLGSALTPDLATAGGYLIESGSAAAPMAPAVVDGVVSRGALFGRLGTARVTTVSAPAGGGKTFLVRSWIGELAYGPARGLRGGERWGPESAAVLDRGGRRVAGHIGRIDDRPPADRGAGPGRLGDHGAPAGGPRRAERARVAGHRRRARAGRGTMRCANWN